MNDHPPYLPGRPIPPSGDEMLDRYIVLSDDGHENYVLGLPIELAGVEPHWLLTLNLTWYDTGLIDYPDHHVGLGEQRLVTQSELDTLRGA